MVSQNRLKKVFNARKYKLDYAIKEKYEKFS
jgi:hypothetical protein